MSSVSHVKSSSTSFVISTTKRVPRLTDSEQEANALKNFQEMTQPILDDMKKILEENLGSLEKKGFGFSTYSEDLNLMDIENDEAQAQFNGQTPVLVQFDYSGKIGTALENQTVSVVITLKNLKDKKKLRDLQKTILSILNSKERYLA